MSPKEECEVLLDALLPAVESLLKKNGEFYPVGAVLTGDANVSFTAVDSGNEHPETKMLINNLIASHRQMAEQDAVKASGIAWNASILTPEGKRSDAIIVSLEHKENYSVIVGRPYKLGLFKKVKFGELFAQSGQHEIF